MMVALYALALMSSAAAFGVLGASIPFGVLDFW